MNVKMDMTRAEQTPAVMLCYAVDPLSFHCPIVLDTLHVVMKHHQRPSQNNHCKTILVGGTRVPHHIDTGTGTRGQHDDVVTLYHISCHGSRCRTWDGLLNSFRVSVFNLTSILRIMAFKARH